MALTKTFFIDFFFSLNYVYQKGELGALGHKFYIILVEFVGNN